MGLHSVFIKRFLHCGRRSWSYEYMFDGMKYSLKTIWWPLRLGDSLVPDRLGFAQSMKTRQKKTTNWSVFGWISSFLVRLCPLAYTGDVIHPPSNCWDWDSLQITSLVLFYFFLSRGVYSKRGENYSSHRVDVGSSGLPITRVTLKASFQLKELQCMWVTLEGTLTSKFSKLLDT